MYAIGMNAHLTKPVQVGRLYTVFKRYVKPVKQEPAAAKPRPATSIVKNSDFANNEVLAARDGLARASGDAALYGEILEEFVKLYAAADDTLGMMMRTGDLEAARKFIHDIKGVSANIGAMHLSQVCDSLNHALMNREESRFTTLINEFNRHLHAVLKEARKYLP